MKKKGWHRMKRTKLFALLGVLSAVAFLLGLTSIGIAGWWPPGGIGGP